MRNIWNLAWKLLVITAVAGLALGITNELTKEPIAEQQLLEAENARRTVLPAAESFEEVVDAGDVLDSAYYGLNEQGEKIGMVGTVTVNGYGGEIEVTVGMDTAGTLTGIVVGGSNFNETVGLGAKTKDVAFTDQFTGLTPPLTLKQDVTPVTGATISSTAVTNGVNSAASALSGLLG